MALTILLSVMGGLIIGLLAIVVIQRSQLRTRWTEEEVINLTRILAFRAQLTKVEFDSWINATIRNKKK